MFPEQSCCLPAQDAEIEEHYFNLLDAGDICAKQSSMAKDALKLVFCAACSPRQPEYTVEAGGKTYFRICSSLVDKVQPKDFDNCGMVRVAERGAPCAGDDVVVPSDCWKYGTDEPAAGAEGCEALGPTNATNCDLAVEDGSSLTHYDYLNCNGTHKFLQDASGAFPPFLDGQSIQIVKCSGLTTGADDVKYNDKGEEIATGTQCSSLCYTGSASQAKLAAAAVLVSMFAALLPLAELL